MLFRRHLEPALVDALNELHASPAGGWWRKLLKDSEIFVALRDNTLNAYYRGCSLAQIKLVGGEVRAYTHYKYLLCPSIVNPYIEARSDQFRFLEHLEGDLGSIFISGPSDVGSMKKAASPYAGDEKKFVGEVIKINGNIFDVEIALSADTSSKDEGYPEPGRIDFALLRYSSHHIEVVMHEVKLFSNTQALRSSGKDEKIPDVLNQIRKYERLLHANADALRDSFIEAAHDLRSIVGMSDQRKFWANAILDSRENFRINLQPVILIGGFDQDQKTGSIWKPHLNKLEEALGKGRVISRGAASSCRLPAGKAVEAPVA